jgi:hypothetical protein
MNVTIARGFEVSYPPLRDYFAQIPASMFRPRALPYASVNYGPLLFALPIPEKDNNTPAEGAKIGYALDANPADAGTIKVTRTAMPAHWDWPYNAPVSLAVPVRAFDWRPTIAQDLPAAPVAGDKSETVQLVPYGCTKFHISMFPVTPHAFEGEIVPQLPKLPELLGCADIYQDAAASKGFAVGYINQPGAGIIWRDLPAGTQLKFRYAALINARLTLLINNGAPQKITFPATGKWQGEGAYAEMTVPVTIPAGAVVRLTFQAGDAPANIDQVQSMSRP